MYVTAPSMGYNTFAFSKDVKKLYNDDITPASITQVSATATNQSFLLENKFLKAFVNQNGLPSSFPSPSLLSPCLFCSPLTFKCYVQILGCYELLLTKQLVKICWQMTLCQTKLHLSLTTEIYTGGFNRNNNIKTKKISLIVTFIFRFGFELGLHCAYQRANQFTWEAKEAKIIEKGPLRVVLSTTVCYQKPTLFQCFLLNYY